MFHLGGGNVRLNHRFNAVRIAVAVMNVIRFRWVFHTCFILSMSWDTLGWCIYTIFRSGKHRLFFLVVCILGS